jgi:hypothetical protein
MSLTGHEDYFYFIYFRWLDVEPESVALISATRIQQVSMILINQIREIMNISSKTINNTNIISDNNNEDDDVYIPPIINVGDEVGASSSIVWMIGRIFSEVEMEKEKDSSSPPINEYCLVIERIENNNFRQSSSSSRLYLNITQCHEYSCKISMMIFYFFQYFVV